MQHVVTWHDVSVYHTCILHSVIYFLCALVQKRCYIVDAKDSEIQHFEVHTTNSLQLLAAKVLLFFDICKYFCIFQDIFFDFIKFYVIFPKKIKKRHFCRLSNGIPTGHCPHGERRKCGNSLEERDFSTRCKPLPTTRTSHDGEEVQGGVRILGNRKYYSSKKSARTHIRAFFNFILF